MKIGVIADDLTGAMDTGAQFPKYGLTTALLLNNHQLPNLEVEIINTGSREISGDNARNQVLEALSLLEGGYLFKKIDSTLRGHPEIEIATLLEKTNYQKAVICPAVIEQGRQIIDGQLLINNKPLHETEFALDPTWPAKSSYVQDRFQEKILSIPLSVVRSDSENLHRYISSSDARLIVPDSSDLQDLERIIEATKTLNYLPCGGMSFARAWVSMLTNQRLVDKTMKVKIRNPILFVSGSHNPKTIQQISKLKNNHEIFDVVVRSNKLGNIKSTVDKFKRSDKLDRSILLRTPKEDISYEKGKNALLDNLASLTKNIIEVYPMNALVICGGETASAVLSELSPSWIAIEGEIVPGFPFGTLIEGIGSNLPFFSKSGGFGSQDILSNLGN